MERRWLSCMVIYPNNICPLALTQPHAGNFLKLCSHQRMSLRSPEVCYLSWKRRPWSPLSGTFRLCKYVSSYSRGGYHSPRGFSMLTVRTSTIRTLTAKVHLMVLLSTAGAVAVLVRPAVSTRIMLPKELQVYNHIETLPEEVRDCRKACYFQLTPTPTDQLNMAGEVGCWEDTFLSDTVSCVDRDVC